MIIEIDSSYWNQEIFICPQNSKMIYYKIKFDISVATKNGERPRCQLNKERGEIPTKTNFCRYFFYF